MKILLDNPPSPPFRNPPLPLITSYSQGEPLEGNAAQGASSSPSKGLRCCA
jgi:hypothetical protein